MEWNNSAREAEMKQITKRPLLSFCIPAYNASGFLKRSVGSILADLGENREIAEILIIENGSTDHTAKVAAQLQTEYPGTVRHLHSEKGPSCARNEGIRNVRGRYTIFVDADDLWTEDKLEKQLQYIEKHRVCLR